MQRAWVVKFSLTGLHIVGVSDPWASPANRAPCIGGIECHTLKRVLQV